MLLCDKKTCNGKYIIKIKDNITGKIIKQINGSNLVRYEGSDILAKAISGETNFEIGYIYGEHADPAASGYVSGSLNGLVAARGDTIATLRTAPRDTVNAESQILYKNYNNSDSSYSYNIATYTVSISSELVNNRIFVGAGLVCKIGTSEYLFSHSYFPGHIKLSNHEIIVIWSVEFI